MSLLDKNLTIREALEILRLNGTDWHEVWLRTQIATGRIKSFKIFNSRVIPRTEIERVISERRAAR